MWGITFESVRICIVGLIVAYLWWVARREDLSRQKGWKLLIVGFLCILLSRLVPLFEIFPLFDQPALADDALRPAFLGQIAGEIAGYALIGAGLWRWIPARSMPGNGHPDLQKYNADLEALVEARTAEWKEANARLRREIEDRKQVEEILRESDKRLQTVIASAPIFLFACDNQGAFTFLEGKGLDALQLEAVDAAGHSLFDVYCELPQVLENKRRALAGEAFTSIERVGDHLFETHYSPLRDAHGAVFSIIGVATDITEWERAKEEVQIQRDFALQVMNTMGQGLVVTDAERRFEFVNAAYARMLGYAPEELIGASFFDTVIPEDCARLTQSFAEQVAGEATTTEIRLRRADTTTVCVLVNTVLRRRDNTVVGAISVITDLTERKQMEEERALARDQALEASRLKSEFLATMSHEIRTPMNAIIGMTDLLSGTALDSSQQEFIGIIRESGQALLTIIDDILDFSKGEAGKLVLDSTDFSLCHVVEGVAELLASKAHEKGLALMTFVDPGIPQILRGDPGRLRQVLLNLVGNAVKFTSQGEVVVRATVERDTGASAIIRFTVRDTGIGISAAARGRLFQLFAQADGSMTRKYGGTGLGLAISKHLTELMGGEIGVESVEGAGATFWFTAQFQRTEASAVTVDLQGMRVLLVDACQTNQEILGRYVSAWGAHAVRATNAAEALTSLRQAALANTPYDLVITGLALPDMDAFALARAIQRDARIARTKLVLLVSFDAWEQGERALQAGFSAYLTKPVKQAQLFTALTGVVPGAPGRPADGPLDHKQNHAAPQAPAQQNGKASDKLILLVEDHPANQRLALRQLERLGYAACAVTNGREAVEAVTRDADAYNLILMDCQTPEMDGFEATRAIRAAERGTRRHIPIIAMTASVMHGDREECLAAGMDDYISKPVVWSVLREVLERWLPSPPGTFISAPLSASAADLLDNVVLDSLRELQDAGEPNFLSDLVEIYFSDAPLFLATMRTAVVEENAKMLFQAAHTFKGSSANIGAKSVAALCRTLEHLGRSGTTEGAEELVQKIEVEYERVKPVLAAECRVSG